MSESNTNYSINEPRFQRVIKYATSASKQIPGALVRVAESEETDINTVRLTLPLPSEINKIAVHYLHDAGFSADKTELTAEGFTFTVDMTQPYED